MSERPLTILFMPESAYGPTNNCIGIGDVLRRRGHRVVFAAEASWQGRLERLGFEEDLVDLAPPSAGAGQDAGQFPAAPPSTPGCSRTGSPSTGWRSARSATPRRRWPSRCAAPSSTRSHTTSASVTSDSENSAGEPS